MIRSRYKLLVFDWDGTLADSLDHIVYAMEQAIRALELEQKSRKELQEVIGLGLNEALTHLYPRMTNGEMLELIDQYRKYYLKLPDQTITLFPGAEATLKDLYDSGYFLAVATGKSRRGLHRAFMETGVEKLFHTSCCADEAFSKPHPQMLKNIMDTLGITPQETVMIGDTEFDLQMARNAGTSAIAVNYGAHEPERLLEFDPLVCISSLEEIPEWLATYN